MSYQMYDSKNSKLLSKFETEPLTMTLNNCTIDTDLMSSITATPTQNFTITCEPESVTYSAVGSCYPIEDSIEELEKRIDKIEEELSSDPRYKFRKGLVII